MKKSIGITIVILTITSLTLVACGGPPVDSRESQPVEASATPQPPTPVPPTDTPVPTETPPPTETPLPSPTPMLAVVDNGFSVWCLKPGSEPMPDTWVMPELASTSTVEDGVIIVPSQMQSCTYVYQLNQPAPANLELWVYDTRPDPFWVQPLTFPPDQLDLVDAYINHQFIVSPPFWEIEYRFELRLPDNMIVKKDSVVIRRDWVGYGVCYGGVLPDPITLKCPGLPEAHPWDPWYGWDDPR